jgi:hypothetical protein
MSMAQVESRLAFQSTIHGLMAYKELTTMSHYEYLAHISEIAAEIAMAKKVAADGIFKELASVPREKLAETVRKLAQ